MTAMVLLFSVLGCRDPATLVDEKPSPGEDTQSDTPTPTPAPEPEPEPEPEPAEDVVRFVVLGDAGEGNADQFAVADAIEQVCANQGCDFALYLGDNFYDRGVDDVDDDQFQYKFEEPYQNLDFPFYVVLGNHDFGEIPIEFWRTDYQVEYTAYSTKWTLPDHFYSQDFGTHLTLYGLNTNMVMLGLGWTIDHGDWIDEALAGSQATWKLAYAHHPILSGGRHGNAGNYEGLWFDPTGIINGRILREWYDDHLCGEIDIYLAGHDHNRQILGPECGAYYVVSGAGAKTTDFEHRDENDVIFEDDTVEGFFWMKLEGRTATIEAWNKNGTMDFSSSFTK